MGSSTHCDNMDSFNTLQFGVDAAGELQQVTSDDFRFSSEGRRACMWERSQDSRVPVTDDTDVLTSIGAFQGPVPHIGEVTGVTLACKLLGKGSFSEVWQCRFEGQSEPVAVKVLGDNSSADSNEARFLKSLMHPNLVQLIDVVEGPTTALVLELCKGGTLSEFMYESQGRCLYGFSDDQRLKPLIEVASAVAYLHSMEIMHRDIKPDNVFLIDTTWQSDNVTGHRMLPTVKLGDLGLARSMANAPAKMTNCVGTMLYMAPENLAACDYGKPADVFSIAILANELVLCERPYSERMSQNGKENMAMMTLLVMQGVRPRLCNHAVAQEFVVPCWNTDPLQRWPAYAIADFLHTEHLQ